MPNNNSARATVLVTGAARRLGAAMAMRLHAEGMNIALHHHRSTGEAAQLRAMLEKNRPGSTSLHRFDLREVGSAGALLEEVLGTHDSLSALINNASCFYPTPIGSAGEDDWDTLINTNLRAPYFLAQAAASSLAESHGCIVNLSDIYAETPLREHSIYNISKAGLQMLTASLAVELAPHVRVNAIAPGPILWPESGVPAQASEKVLSTTPMARMGSAEEIAGAALYLIRDATYTTGATLPVDGGRRLSRF